MPPRLFGAKSPRLAEMPAQSGDPESARETTRAAARFPHHPNGALSSINAPLDCGWPVARSEALDPAEPPAPSLRYPAVAGVIVAAATGVNSGGRSSASTVTPSRLDGCHTKPRWGSREQSVPPGHLDQAWLWSQIY